MGLVRFAVKSSVAGGIIYYTVQEGLWSRSEESIKLYGKIYNNVAPYVKENIPKEVVNELPVLPSTSDITNYAKSGWNRGVIATFKFISELPTHTSNGIDALSAQPAVKDAIGSIKDAFSGPAESGKAQ